jgi:hypothetical protein
MDGNDARICWKRSSDCFALPVSLRFGGIGDSLPQRDNLTLGGGSLVAVSTAASAKIRVPHRAEEKLRPFQGQIFVMWML